MDGQATRCASCGASVTAARFCTSCGAQLVATQAAPTPDATSDDTSTHERIPVVSAAPRHAQPVPAQPAYVAPPQPLAPPSAPRRSPGPGLWVAAAASLLVVLLIGTFL
ncbi:MAG: hypothetical protein WB797_18085, partial [Nocardioides sp.]